MDIVSQSSETSWAAPDLGEMEGRINHPTSYNCLRRVDKFSPLHPRGNRRGIFILT